eukprot:gene4169-3010_t
MLETFYRDLGLRIKDPHHTERAAEAQSLQLVQGDFNADRMPPPEQSIASYEVASTSDIRRTSIASMRPICCSTHGPPAAHGPAVNPWLSSSHKLLSFPYAAPRPNKHHHHLPWQTGYGLMMPYVIARSLVTAADQCDRRGVQVRFYTWAAAGFGYLLASALGNANSLRHCPGNITNFLSCFVAKGGDTVGSFHTYIHTYIYIYIYIYVGPHKHMSVAVPKQTVLRVVLSIAARMIPSLLVLYISLISLFSRSSCGGLVAAEPHPGATGSSFFPSPFEVYHKRQMRLAGAGCRAAQRSALWSASRRFTASGRGDIFYAPALLERLEVGRERGASRGLRHASQSTQPESGKLRCRSHILHATGLAAASDSHPTAQVSRWSYLIPSLSRAASANLGRRHFLFEVQRRLPLLEDAVAEAELRYLVRWPSVFRRAGVALPGCTENCRLAALHQHVAAAVEVELAAAEEEVQADGVSARRRREVADWRKAWNADIEWHENNGPGPSEWMLSDTAEAANQNMKQPILSLSLSLSDLLIDLYVLDDGTRSGNLLRFFVQSSRPLLRSAGRDPALQHLSLRRAYVRAMELQALKIRNRDVGRRSRRHLYCLLFSGAVLATVLLVVAIVGAVNEIIWVKHVAKKGSAYISVDKYSSIAPELYQELELRILHPTETQAIADIHYSWTTSFWSISSDMDTTTLGVLKTVIEDFESVTQMGDIFYFYVQILTIISSLVFSLLRSSYTSRGVATADSLALYSSQAAIGSLMARVSFFYSKEATFPVSADDGNGLILQWITASFAPLFSSQSQILASSFDEIMGESIDLYQQSCQFEPSAATVEMLSLASVETFIAYLQKVADGNTATVSIQPLYYFVAATALCLVGATLCCCVFYRYCRKTRTSRYLIKAFESKTVNDHLLKQYMPLIQDLRPTSGRDEGQSNELARVYSIAASWLDVLRVATPQLLFGRPDGTATEWAVAARKARFGIRKPDERHHVVMMEVTLDITGNGESPLNELELGVQLEVMNAAYRIVVGEVNRAGGIVLGTRGNLSILAVWNTTWTSHNAEVLALRAGYTIEHCLKEVRGLPRVLIALVTGPMVAGNIEGGGRRYACAMSTSMSYLAVMKRVGQEMGCTIVVDRTTSRRLPRAVSRRLKPIVVVRLTTPDGGNNYVVYSCNDKAMEDEEQAAHYIRGFSLYQNNLFNEAVVAFEGYLAIYPDDTSARWLYELVLKPKFGMSHMTATRRSGATGIGVLAMRQWVPFAPSAMGKGNKALPIFFFCCDSFQPSSLSRIGNLCFSVYLEKIWIERCVLGSTVRSERGVVMYRFKNSRIPTDLPARRAESPAVLVSGLLNGRRVASIPDDSLTAHTLFIWRRDFVSDWFSSGFKAASKQTAIALGCQLHIFHYSRSTNRFFPLPSAFKAQISTFKLRSPPSFPHPMRVRTLRTDGCLDRLDSPLLEATELFLHRSTPLCSHLLQQWRAQVENGTPPAGPLRFTVQLSLIEVMQCSPCLGAALLAGFAAALEAEVERVWAIAVDRFWSEAALQWIAATLSTNGGPHGPWATFFAGCSNLVGLQCWSTAMQRLRAGQRLDIAPAALGSICTLEVSGVPSPAGGRGLRPGPHRLVGVVRCVYFASRQMAEPLGWVEVRPALENSGPVMVRVDPAGPACQAAGGLRSLLQVGRLVTAAGEMRLATASAHPPAPASPSLCGLGVYFNAAGGIQRGAVARPPPMAAGGATAADDPATAPDEAEEAAAALSVQCWLGFRVLGGAPLPGERRAGPGACVSLDAAVSLLLVSLWQPHAAAREDAATLSLFVTDEEAFEPWVERAATSVDPTLAAVPSLAQLRRWQSRDYIPAYGVRRRPTPLPSPAAGTFMESVRAGVLSGCAGATLVLQQIELMPASALLLLPPLCTRDGPGTVQRDGGQCCPYHTPAALVFCLRDGSQLLRSSQLFAVAERADVALRPVVAESRLEMWSEALQHEHSATALTARCSAWRQLFRRAVDVLRTGDPVPCLTEGCGALLQSYHLAAKAVFGSAVETPLMEKLAKLTTAHAVVRSSLQVAAGHRGEADAHTRLIDALVAIALCDSTLHFITGRTVIGRCLLEAAEAHYCGPDPPLERGTCLPPPKPDTAATPFIIPCTAELLRHFASLMATPSEAGDSAGRDDEQQLLTRIGSDEPHLPFLECVVRRGGFNGFLWLGPT